MALTPSVRASQSAALLAAEATDLRLSQAAFLAAYNRPTTEVRASQLAALVLTVLAVEVRASQAAMLVAARGVPRNRNVRAWGFSLDDHEFYVIRLGDAETLVLDLTTRQWASWDTAGRPSWRAHLGGEWTGIGRANYLGGARTQIVAGDDVYGVLWTLDPSSDFDDHPLPGGAPQYFTRQVTAGIPARMRQSMRGNAIFLMCDIGFPSLEPALLDVSLSDDNGKTFYSLDPVSVTPGEFHHEFMWRSTGLIRAPGRLFVITDRGATVRLDGLDIRVTDETAGG